MELSAELESYRSAIAATIKSYIEIQLTDNNKPTLWQMNLDIAIAIYCKTI